MILYFTEWVVILLIIWGLLKYLSWKHKYYDHLEKIGGPKAYPFVGNLYLFFGARRSDIFDIFLKISKEYGPFFRTYNGFTPEVVLTKPEHLEMIMSSSIHIKKSWVYLALKEWLGDGLLISHGAKWHQRRKMITPTFHFKILKNFMAIFIEKSKLLTDYLNEKSDGKPFDIYPYITHCALDIICETAMGVSINAMSNRNSSYIRALYNTSELIIRKRFSVIQQTPLYPLLKDGRAFYKNLKVMHDFTNKVIADRRMMLQQSPVNEDDLLMLKEKRQTFLDLILNSSESLSDADIRAEVDTFMFGGHDTTTAGICWTIYLLGLNQDFQEKAYQEIKSVVGNRKAPETISDLNEMKYLEYCIKETLRLFPSVPLISRQLTQDITLDGYKIPKGTNIGLNIYFVHRDPIAYPDPEKFDPDRFLPENCKNRHPYAYVPFSAGPRNCVGQKFAMYEEKTVLATILRSYRIKPVDTPETLKIVSEVILRPQKELRIALEKRTD